MKTMRRAVRLVVRIPNAATRKAMRDARAGRKLTTWSNVEMLKTART
jgi:hypothetical protein